MVDNDSFIRFLLVTLSFSIIGHIVYHKAYLFVNHHKKTAPAGGAEAANITES